MLEFDTGLNMKFIVLGILYFVGSVDSSTVVTLTRRAEECSYGQNVIRSNHAVPKLAWDDALRNFAEDWAIRCALNRIMEHPGGPDLLYATSSSSESCNKPFYLWYSTGLKHYNYEKPGWSSYAAYLLQMVFSTMKSYGMGTATYNGMTYIVSRYNTYVPYRGPFDLKHVPKPRQKLSERDLTPRTRQSKQLIQVPIPQKEGWTDWVRTSGQCSIKCDVGSVTEERWCVRLKSKDGCKGPRKRTVSCPKNDCKTNCVDLNKNCKWFAETGKYCNNSTYGKWMKINCKKSCKVCS